MAYPRARSMNGDLHEGMTDGGWKKIAMNRGGDIDPLTYEARKALSDIWYGFHEVNPKMLPDGRMCSTPDFEPNEKAQFSV
jgi:hypothetical protein